MPFIGPLTILSKNGQAGAADPHDPIQVEQFADKDSDRQAEYHLELPLSKGIKQGKAFYDLGKILVIMLLAVIDIENHPAQQASRQHFFRSEHKQMPVNGIPI